MTQALDRDTLFLVEPGFRDGDDGPFYCGDSLPLEGFLALHPEVRTHVDVRALRFQRPRQAVARLLGEENQSLPAFVLAAGSPDFELAPKTANGVRFFDDERLIRRYLSRRHGLPRQH